MTEISKEIASISTAEQVSKSQIVEEVKERMTSRGYEAVELDDTRPWGAFVKFNNNQADSFVADFFPDLDIIEARLGNQETELSPKILIVSPDQRLSWQYHNRRAERWTFLTDGSCERSLTDEEGEVIDLKAGESLQFEPSERHRLIGKTGKYTLVAEIWQHTDADHPSDEADIVRLADDYSR